MDKLMNYQTRKDAILLKLLKISRKTEETCVWLIPSKLGGNVEVRGVMPEKSSEFPTGQLFLSPTGKLGMCVGFSIGSRGQTSPWFLFEKEEGISSWHNPTIASLVKVGYHPVN